MQEKEQDQDAGVGNLGEDSDKIGAGRACHQTRVTDEYDLDMDLRSQESGVRSQSGWIQESQVMKQW